MSKKYRQQARTKRPAVKVNEPPKGSETSVIARTIRDAMLNAPARIGTSDHIMSQNRYEPNRLTQNYAKLDTLYRSDWIAGRIINQIAEDMTKNWYKLTCSIEPDKMDELAAMERKLHVKERILEGVRWGRLYGGAAGIIMIKGQEDMLDQPLDYDMVQPGTFRGILIVDRWNGVYPGLDVVSDLDDPDFGLPEYYTLSVADSEIEQGVRVHHSRVLRFVGRELPYIEKLNENYWGMSELEHVYEELNKRNTTSANIAQLVFVSHLRVLKMSDLGQTLALGDMQSQQDLYNTVRAQNELMNNFSLQILDAQDDFQTQQYTFSGLSDIYELFMNDIAGAAEIPATKLFGRSPAGMDASGEGDLRNYYDTIRQWQEAVLRPIMDKLIPIMCLSCWGVIPDDLDFEFEPIRDTSDEERANLIQQTSGAINSVFQSGIISQKTALKELRQSGEAIGMWTNITDEDIENADDQPQGGEEEGEEDPMAAMMGAMGQNGAEQPQNAPRQPEQGQSGQEPMPEQKAPQGQMKPIKEAHA